MQSLWPFIQLFEPTFTTFTASWRSGTDQGAGDGKYSSRRTADSEEKGGEEEQLLRAAHVEGPNPTG